MTLSRYPAVDAVLIDELDHVQYEEVKLVEVLHEWEHVLPGEAKGEQERLEFFGGSLLLAFQVDEERKCSFTQISAEIDLHTSTLQNTLPSDLICSAVYFFPFAGG